MFAFRASECSRKKFTLTNNQTNNNDMGYYNTTNQSGTPLEESKNKASTQEGKILQLFIRNGKSKFSPSQVWAMGFNEYAPLTSIRRSLSDLTRKGLLEKTNHKVEGLYGRVEYTWRLKSKPSTQGELL